MSRYKNGYLTRTAITSEIKKVIAKAHGLNSSDLLINWLTPWREYKFPTGWIEKYAKIRVRAEGFNTHDFILTQEKHKKWHMR